MTTGQMTYKEIKPGRYSILDFKFPIAEMDGADEFKAGIIDAAEAANASPLTDAEIKTQYENNPDTNEFSDAEKTKLAGVEASATADQSNAEIKTAYEANANTNAFTDAEQTKLAGIEIAADVTDSTNVNAAGATMNADTDLSANGWFLNEDDMASDSDTKAPSQQSVKAYVGVRRLSFVQTVDTTNRSTTSGTPVASGLQVIVDPVVSGSKIRVQVVMYIGLSIAGSVSFSLYRNVNAGGDVDITPVGNNVMAAVRVGDNLGMFCAVIDFEDTHGGSGGDDVIYKVYWATSGGTAYIGRRGSSTTFDITSVMTAEEAA